MTKVAFGISVIFLGSSMAHAGSFYVETAGGVAKFQQASPFYGASAPNSTGIGYDTDIALMANLGSGGPIEFHVGLQNRLSSASAGSQNYLFEALYPEVRVQFSRIYLSFGATPLVWMRNQTTPGLDQIASASGALSMLGEAGMLWPITPEFSLGLAAGAQAVKSSGTLSPKPILDGTVLMRFYFGFFKSGSEASSDEFKGWRYPFGHLR